MKVINILTQIWESCLGFKGKKSKELLSKIGFDHNQVEIGYINNEKKRHRNNAELQEWLDVGFIKEKNKRSRGNKEPDRAVYAANGIIVPLKDADNNICNFYCLDSLFGDYDYLYKDTGLYPHYPTIDTQTLIINLEIIRL